MMVEMIDKFPGQKMRPKELVAKLETKPAICRACGDAYVGLGTVCNTCAPGYEACREDVAAWLSFAYRGQMMSIPGQIRQGIADGFAAKKGT